jgi:hypothetical protein
LIFDCGGLGMCTGGHAHADALSVSLFGGGRELLLDPGTFTYNSAPEWREYFRSTQAHNTVRIDGRDQAESAGTFRWNTRWRAKPGFRTERDGIRYIEGEHDGYLALAEGVTHRRRLLHVGEYWLLADDFRGTGPHTFEFSFHLGPDVECSGIEHNSHGFLIREREGFLLGFLGSGEVTSECLTGSVAPIGGWASTGYGAKRPVTSIRAAMRAAAPAAAMAFLVPAQSGATLQAIPTADRNVLACRYRQGAFNGGFEDLAVFGSVDSTTIIDGFEMSGEFFWLRSAGGSLRHVAAVRARSLFDRGRCVFEQTEPGPYFSALTDGGVKGDESLCAASAAS